MTKFITAYIVCANEEEANNIAKKIVQERVAACANILPSITSYYWWNGEVQNAKEVAMLAKTTQENFTKLKELVLQLHSYEVPCIISLPIEEVEEKYANWIKTEVR